jgi:ParB family chromosome partitioning protein
MSTVISQSAAPPPAIAFPNSSPFPEIALDAIFPSKTNPRKTYDQASLDGLADSIRAQGVVQPIVLRKAGKGYEIVAGERRYRASRIAGKSTIPAIVRELTDREVVEIQITENEQREDVKAIEQGRGYRTLLDELAKEKPKAIRQSLIEEVAARIGKSVRHVYSRMKLAELSPKILDKLEAGAIEASHADELVRLQAVDQDRAIEFLFDRREWNGSKYVTSEARSVRELKAWIAKEVQSDLSAAPWNKDDADLVLKAGACSACEKRTGANPKLHPEVKAGKDLCLDRPCFDLKRAAFVRVQVLTLELEVREDLKNAGASNAKILKADVPRISAAQSEHNSSLPAKEKSGVAFAGYHSGDKGYVIVKAGACDKARAAVVVEGLDAGKRETVCLASSGCTKHFAQKAITTAVSGKDADRAKEARRKELEKARLNKAVQLALDRAIVTAGPAALSIALYQRIAVSTWSRLEWNRKTDLLAVLALEPKKKQYGNDLDTPVVAYLKTFKTAAEFHGFLLLISLSADDNDATIVSRADVFKAIKLDPAKIRKDIETTYAAKAKAKPAAKPAKKVKAGTCAKCGCTPAHRCVIELKGKGKATTCKLVDGVCSSCAKPKKVVAKKGGR